MCVVKLETCHVRAIIAAIVASRATGQQCEQILKTHVLFFFVSRIIAPLDASLSVRKDLYDYMYAYLP